MSAKARLFLDSSVWIAGIGSPLGGAGWIIFLAEAGELEVLVSEQVLVEVRRTLASKKIRYASRFEKFVEMANPLVLPQFKEIELLRWVFLVPPKDCHVLAGAFKAKADALISLDQEHILTPKVRNSFPIPLLTPGEFLAAFHAEND